MDQPIPERRKTIVVNAPVQRRITLAITLVPAIALAMTSLVAAIFCQRLVHEAQRFDVELANVLPLLCTLLVFVAVSGAVILLQAVRVSHRIAGPAYRITMSLRRIREGDLDFTVRLRKGDHLTEVADELNSVLAKLRADRAAAAGDAPAAEPAPEPVTSR